MRYAQAPIGIRILHNLRKHRRTGQKASARGICRLDRPPHTPLVLKAPSIRPRQYWAKASLAYTPDTPGGRYQTRPAKASAALLAVEHRREEHTLNLSHKQRLQNKQEAEASMRSANMHQRQVRRW